jgi:hypothetical protein
VLTFLITEINDIYTIPYVLTSFVLSMPPRYIWNIVKSGVIHHSPNPTIKYYIACSNCHVLCDEKFRVNVIIVIFSPSYARNKWHIYNSLRINQFCFKHDNTLITYYFIPVRLILKYIKNYSVILDIVSQQHRKD